MPDRGRRKRYGPAVKEMVRRFRDWRRLRPFWAGVFTLGAGLIILFPPYASLRFGDIEVSLNTLGGMSSLLIGVVMLTCASMLWTRPQSRVAAGVVTLLFALAAIVAANLGVFLIGTMLGIIGAGLALAWRPAREQEGRAAGLEWPRTDQDAAPAEAPSPPQPPRRAHRRSARPSRAPVPAASRPRRGQRSRARAGRGAGA